MHVRELKKRLIPLTVNNLLVAPHNLKVLLHHIHALIRAPAHDKDTPEHLQDARVENRSGGGTITTGSAGRSSSKSGRTSTRSPWILGHCGVKRLMCYIHPYRTSPGSPPQSCTEYREQIHMISMGWWQCSKSHPQYTQRHQSAHTCFMRASNKFRSYASIASKYSILGARVFLIILCSTKK
jgi:hypothetical protein